MPGLRDSMTSLILYQNAQWHVLPPLLFRGKKASAVAIWTWPHFIHHSFCTLPHCRCLIVLLCLHSRGGRKHRSKAHVKPETLEEPAPGLGMENPNRHFCRLCNRLVQNNEVSLDEHFLGKSHLRLEKLEMLEHFF